MKTADLFILRSKKQGAIGNWLYLGSERERLVKEDFRSSLLAIFQPWLKGSPPLPDPLLLFATSLLAFCPA